MRRPYDMLILTLCKHEEQVWALLRDKRVGRTPFLDPQQSETVRQAAWDWRFHEPTIKLTQVLNRQNVMVSVWDIEAS